MVWKFARRHQGIIFEKVGNLLVKFETIYSWFLIHIQSKLPKPAADLFCKYRYSVQIGAVDKARIPPLWYNSKQFCIYRILSTVETGRISWSQRYIWHCPNRTYWFFINVFQPLADRPMFTCQLMLSHLVTSIATMSVHARATTQRWLIVISMRWFTVCRVCRVCISVISPQ